MTKNPSTKADKVIAFRKSIGLTYAEFARALGVHERTVYKWESGERKPPYMLFLLLTLCRRFPEVSKAVFGKE